VSIGPAYVSTLAPEDVKPHLAHQPESTAELWPQCGQTMDNRRGGADYCPRSAEKPAETVPHREHRTATRRRWPV